MDGVGGSSGAVGSAAATFDPNGVLVVTLTGEVDISNVDRLHASIEPALAHAPDVAVFDLAELRFMDSSGIAMLLRAAAHPDGARAQSVTHGATDHRGHRPHRRPADRVMTDIAP